MDQIDRPGGLAIDNIPALTNHRVMKSDPVWAQLAPEMAALQTLVLELKTQHNLLAVAASQPTLVCVSPDPKL
jgi:hypothetical protein